MRSDCSSFSFLTAHTVTSCRAATLQVEDPPGAQHQWATVSITPPGGSACKRTFTDRLTKVPKPTVTQATGPTAYQCPDQPVLVTLQGSYFALVDGQLPAVTFNGSPVTASQPQGCQTIPVSTAATQTFQHCTQLQALVTPTGADGSVSVTYGVTNQAPLDTCVGTRTGSLNLLSPPTVNTALMDVDGRRLLSFGAGAPASHRTVTLEGSFYVISGQQPTVTVGGVPAAAATGASCNGASPVNRCSQLTLVLPAALVVNATGPLLPDLTIQTHDLSCASTFSNVLVVVPPIDVPNAPFPGICNTLPPPATAPYLQDFVLAGTGFVELVSNGQAALLPVGQVTPLQNNPAMTPITVTVTTSGCQLLAPAVLGSSLLAGTRICSSVRLEIDPADLDTTVTSTVRVENQVGVGASPSDYGYDMPGVLVQFPQNELASVTPPGICLGSANDTVLQLSGKFFAINDVLPRVSIGGLQFNDRVGSSCQSQNYTGADVFQCLTMTVTLDQQTASQIATGDVPVKILATDQCFVEQTMQVGGVPTPQIDAAQPDRMCVVLTNTVTLLGDRLAQYGAQDPQFYVEGTQVSLVGAGGGLAGCNTTAPSVNECQNATVQIPPSAALATRALENPGSAVIRVVNDPAGGACDVTVSNVLDVVPVPIIDSVTPGVYCYDQGGLINITGQYFDVMHVSVLLKDPVLGTFAPSSVVSVTETEILVQFDKSYVLAGQYDVEVTNIAGCVATASEAVHVHPQLFAFFAQPSVVYNGIVLQATLYTSGLLSQVKKVFLRFQAFEDTVFIEYNGSNETSFEPPSNYNKITLVLPTGMAPGDWKVELLTSIGCTVSQNDVLKVTQSTTTTITGISPKFMYNGESSGLTVLGGGTGFVDVPDVYLSVSNPKPTDLASSVRSVSYVSSTELKGIVASGLTKGTYTMVVINPDETVGLEPDAIVMLDQPLPTINSVLPAVIESGKTSTFQIIGTNFPTGSPPNVNIIFTCAGVAESPVQGSVCTGTCSSTVLEFDFVSAQTDGSLCIVTVENLDIDDGAGNYLSASFSALPIKNPSGKWQSANTGFTTTGTTALPAKLRGMAGFNIRVNEETRLICTAGGVQSSTVVSQPLSTVQCNEVKTDGAMGAQWVTQTNGLATAVSFAGAAVVERFVYVIGGRTSTGATQLVQRAQMLDPNNKPELDVAIQLVPDLNATWAAATYYYKVAPFFASTWASNPDGEGLQSEALALKLPAAAVSQIRLDLQWTEIPGAAGYRLYRTQTGGLSVNNLKLHAVLVGQTSTAYLDTGLQSALPATGSNCPSACAQDHAPTLLGSFGKWHQSPTASATNSDLPRLATARIGPLVATVPTYSSNHDHAIFVFGGYSTDGTMLSSVERIMLSLNQVSTVATEVQTSYGSQWYSAPSIGSQQPAACSQPSPPTCDACTTHARAMGHAAVVTVVEYAPMSNLYPNNYPPDHKIILGTGGASNVFAEVDLNTAQDNIDGYRCTGKQSPNNWQYKGGCYTVSGNNNYWFSGAQATMTFPAGDVTGVTTGELGDYQDLEPLTNFVYSDQITNNDNPSNGFVSGGQSPSAVTQCACVQENGNLYIIGGYSSSTGDTVTRVERLPGI